MEGDRDRDPYVVFTPPLGRFIAVELWSTALAIAVGATVFYVLGRVRWTWFLLSTAVAVAGIVFGAASLRRRRRIVIGDTWITGPTIGSSGSTSLEFGTVDRGRTRIARGRLRIRSLGGQEISARTAWYSPEDVEEIKRLLRDRCGAECWSEGVGS